jgi:hypothetical protein
LRRQDDLAHLASLLGGNCCCIDHQQDSNHTQLQSLVAVTGNTKYLDEKTQPLPRWTQWLFSAFLRPAFLWNAQTVFEPFSFYSISLP